MCVCVCERERERERERVKARLEVRERKIKASLEVRTCQGPARMAAERFWGHILRLTSFKSKILGWVR